MLGRRPLRGRLGYLWWISMSDLLALVRYCYGVIYSPCSSDVLVHRSDHLGTQSQASLDMAGSPVSNSADSQRILGGLLSASVSNMFLDATIVVHSGHHTSTSSIFLRRPVSPASNANTCQQFVYFSVLHLNEWFHSWKIKPAWLSLTIHGQYSS